MSLQNVAHALTAQLSCYGQNFIAINLLEFGWEQNQISIELESRWKNRSCNEPLDIIERYVTWIRFMKYFPRHSPLCEGNPRITDDSPHKGQWCVAMMFSLMCVWTKVCANSRDAGDFRSQGTHCDVIVMWNAINPGPYLIDHADCVGYQYPITG